MSFRIAADLRYRVHERSTVLFNLHALQTEHQKLTDENFTVTRGAHCDFFSLETGENRSLRIDTADLSTLLLTYRVEASTTPSVFAIEDVEPLPLTHIDPRFLSHLFPSRYCPSDRLGNFAAKTFGHIRHPLAQASAVTDWIHQHIDYQPGSSDPNTNALDTLIGGAGVCRDFAHLGVALCRALSIPARYVTGYACDLQPPDFHAFFEVSVGNRWFVFDATRLAAPNGIIRIASGRDAAATSQASAFGNIELESMEVSCSSHDFQPLTRSDLEGHGVVLES